MASARSSRAPSFSSDRPSVASSITFQMPTTVRPAPAYIAASVASQIVTDHHNAQLREEDADSEELENAVFSEQALSLLNAFLDHLLFAFLSSARSPSLTAIRPAIADVLKPRLAREATEAADEELQGLLAGEDEEFPAQDGRPVDKWDVEKVWKRTRLRIMVYTRLGELEDEDEEKYVQQERGLSMDDDEDDEAGLVSWASAIFLTSVVEYVAEQTLLVAGSAAFARMAAKMKKLAQEQDESGEPTFERLVIEEPDVEKIALNSALGRLWRTWRKRVRSPISPMSPGRGIRPVSSYSSLHRRKMSHDTVDGQHSPIPEHTPTETEIAANIPLPIGHNDVNEIEVPGLARTFETDDESAGMQTPVPNNRRPSSAMLIAPPETRRRTTRDRPLSMPPPVALPFTVAPLISKAEPVAAAEAETPFQTPMEYATKRRSFMALEEQPSLPSKEQEAQEEHESSESPQEADADMMAFAASTGMGFRMSTVDPITTEVPEKEEEEADIPSAGGYESEPKIMKSKRMSVEKTGPPGIVRTFSTRSSSLRSATTPVATPKASQQPEARSYLDDSHSTDEEAESHAIGVARTSDIPIRSTPTPPIDTFTDRGKHAAHGGYVEVQPRQTAPTSISVRNTPSPDARPVVPDRSVARKDLHKRDLSGEDYATANQYPNVTSAPRRQDGPPKSRGASLPSLKEVDSNNGRQRTPPETVPTPTTPQRSPNRDIPIIGSERPVQRKSTDDSKRSIRGAPGGSPGSEKSGVQRVASSSSRKKSGSFTAKHSGRDSEASQRSQVLRGRMSEEDREREFDSLVKGEETVKFTLTPQTVRDIDPTRPPVSNVTVHPRVNADRDNSFGTANLPNRSTSRSKGPVAAQTKASPSRKVVTRPLAREPRIDNESMRDFADFIRSTGPTPGQEKPVQPFVNISGNGPKAANNSTSSLGRKLSTKQNGSHMDGPSAKPRINMEPRSPAGLSSGNDDLIDFIRQGPPNSSTGQPRIPRSVAPFRTTVDSDQFDTMLGGNNVESAYGSTASTLDSKNSAQTINSRTGLIPEPKVVQPAYSNTPQKLSGNMASNAEPHITKTRRRVKDPYAIDMSDDEDEDQLTALPPSSQPQPQSQAPRQESLMDFLNGMDPPSNNKPQPFMLSPETIAAAKARATASNSTLSSTHTATRNGPGPYGAISSTSVASDAPRAYKPRLQARAPAVGDVRAGKTSTSDLADFLRNSGPPEPVAPVVQANGKEEKKTNLPQSPAPPNHIPKLVVFPNSTHQTSLILSACHARRIAVTSFGAGTSFGGALSSIHSGICISFEHMTSIIALHENDMDITVQPGLGWVALNAQIAHTGLFFPVDPAPSASIGGMIGMSCSGTNAYRYGTMKEWVISLTVVFADGKVVRTHRRPRKSAAGYDITHLIIGSEGTLGLVTEATLRLAALPRNLHVGVATFDSFDAGVDLVVRLQREGEKLEALELADGAQMHCLNYSKLSTQHFDEVPTLFFKVAGSSQQVVDAQIELVERLAREALAGSFEVTNEEKRIGVLWGARKAMGTALVMMKKNPTDVFIHSDCAVPISNLAALVSGTHALIQKANNDGGHDWFCANVGHIGDGNVHSSIICPAEDKEEGEAVLKDVARLALRLEGTVTGEHGVGLELRGVLEEEVGSAGVEVMRAVKRSLDERGILNPDKVFELERRGGDSGVKL
ncbi:hypothetical protein FB567DRAFT_557307 [Paraphoma chrysanthemicola]|uniref:FAD-binding PCMH-type domain-containing protein n=1 Tax=Paraphoma chrysanthemicola TaxID=798071 RepID=A0A8K0W435_9PLEO|nr:hypothetical protein FB567DRAFT_557307 [Paraphoma chrysanthemicola]